MVTIIENCLLVDGTGAPARPGTSVLINKGRVEEVASTISAEVRPDLRIDANGQTVIPGLIDSHVHLVFGFGLDPLSEYLNDSDLTIMVRAVRNAQAALGAGITTLRDCGDRGNITLRLRDAINAGILAGPRLLVSGMPLTTTGGHCNFLGLEADSVDEVRKATRGQLKAGVDFVKVMASGGNLTPGSNSRVAQYDADTLEMIVHEAHRVGKKVAAHCHASVSCRDAISAGIDTIEHCSWLEQPTGTTAAADSVMDYDGDSVEEMVRKGLYLSPGMGRLFRVDPDELDVSQERREFFKTFRQLRFESTRRMIAAGVKMIAGTDAGLSLCPFEDFSLLFTTFEKEFGMSKMDILLSATKVPAEAHGLADRIGTVEVGKVADLVLLNGDPTVDLGAYRKVSAVLRSGRLVARDGKVITTAEQMLGDVGNGYLALSQGEQADLRPA